MQYIRGVTLAKVKSGKIYPVKSGKIYPVHVRMNRKKGDREREAFYYLCTDENINGIIRIKLSMRVKH